MEVSVYSWFSSAATLRRNFGEKAAFVVLCQIDMILTALAVSAGHLELNPFVAFLLQFPVMFVLIKGIVPLLIAWAIPGKMLWPAITVLLLALFWNVKELVLLLF